MATPAEKEFMASMTGWMNETQKAIQVLIQSNTTTRQMVQQSANDAAEAAVTALLNARPANPDIDVQQNQDPPRQHQPQPRRGNLTKCSARFRGQVDDVEVFLAAVNAYRTSNHVADDDAIAAMPCLLLEQAATWWSAVKTNVNTWAEVERLLNFSFGHVWTNSTVLLQWIALVHEATVPSELFIAKCRSILSHFSDEAAVSDVLRLDMTYTKLHANLRGRINRSDFNSFDTMITKCREIENLWREYGLLTAPSMIVPTQQTAAAPRTATPFYNQQPQQQHRLNVAVNQASQTFKCEFHRSNSHTAAKCKQNFGPLPSGSASTPVQSPNRSFASSGTLDSSASSFSPSLTTPATAAPQPRPIICLRCGQPGHISAGCPSRQQYQQFHQQQQLQQSQQTQPQQQMKMKTKLAALTLNTASQRNRIYTCATVLGKPELSLLDGGSSNCVLGHHHFDSIESEIVLPPSQLIDIKMADKRHITTSCHVLLLPLRLGEGAGARSINWKFIYTPHLIIDETIIGSDLFEELDIDVHYKTRGWCFRDNPSCVFPDRSPELKKLPSIECAAAVFEPSTLETSALDEQGQQLVDGVLSNFPEVFTEYGPPSTLGTHRIPTGDVKGLDGGFYSIPSSRRVKVLDMINEMRENNIIEPCESSWSSPLLVIPKSEGGLRLCVDYRQLNAVTTSDCYPMPSIDRLLFRTDRRNFVSLLDLRSGFWQIPVAEIDRDKTAFACEFGSFQFLRMPFGLKGAPATFQRAMDNFARSIPHVHVHAYLDDLIIISPTFNQHLKDLETVFNRLRQTNLRVNKEKCRFVCEKFKYLGHIITTEGVSTDPNKVSAITDLPRPTSAKQVSSFVSTCSWYRRFIPDFANIARPLTDLLKKGTTFVWTENQQLAFDKLKTSITTAPCLATADDTKPFYLYTDASNYALGAVLCQGEEGFLRPIEFASRLMIPAERNYSTTEREALAVVWALDRFRGYLECAQVRLLTDHQPLRWLLTLKSPQGRLARWALRIQGYDADIKYVPGKVNCVADLLSRPPIPTTIAADLAAIEVSFEPVSVVDLRTRQLADPDVAKIIKALEASPPLPTEVERWTGRGFVTNRGVLYKCSSDDELEEPQLFAPRDMRDQIIRDHHDAETAGHLGTRRTFARIAQKFYWPGLWKEVADYVRCCTTCQRYKPSNSPPIGLIQTPAPQRRFETIAVDLVGPLPCTPGGNRWILSAEDLATRYIEVFAVPEATAEVCARTLIAEYFLRYGVPRKMVSDNGTQFVSRVMQYTAEYFRVRQSLIPVHRPQANPVERKHRDLKTMLAIFVKQHHTLWDTFLPAVRFAMNTAVTQATGYTPAYLVFAGELRSPAHINADVRPVDTTENFSADVVPYIHRLDEALVSARETLAADQDRRLARTEEDETDLPVFEPGDRVYVQTYFLSSSSTSTTAKFYPRRDGPYVIVRRCSPTAYEIASPDRPEVILGKYHITDLTPIVGPDNDKSAIRQIRRRGRPSAPSAPVENQDIAPTAPLPVPEPAPTAPAVQPARRGRGRPRKNRG